MSRRTQRNVGVIGLGIIGRRVADSLRRRGFHVFVWNRTPRPVPNFVGSPAEIAQLCDFIQIFVSDDDALLEMVQQMKQSLKSHHIVMAHCTVAPHSMRAAAEIVHRRGAQFLDAPFTGSRMAAEKGELIYYVAGDDAAYRRARPVLEASSREIIEIGAIGQATTIKLATNMVTAATVQAAAEALALVHASGIEVEKLMAALRGNACNSATLSMKVPKMIEADFDPHFSVKHMLKDVEIAARMARSHGLSLTATEAARDSLRGEAQEGRGDDDYSSLVHAFFPDGLPGQRRSSTDEAEEQATLQGLDAGGAETEAAPLEGAEEELETAPEPFAIEPEDETELAVMDEPATITEPERETSSEQEAAEQPDAFAEDQEPSREEQPAEVESQMDAGAEQASNGAHEERPDDNDDTEPVAAGASQDAPAEAASGARRGFFSRMFGKGFDY